MLSGTGKWRLNLGNQGVFPVMLQIGKKREVRTPSS
jgi:hypothetical protein